ncbi:DUF2066 domain-containing protein [Glaciecola sp. MH2013]|uniref:DUF2066 domain-containing protein n=1 Tax=Glaciecola sp. MH2013 TaxID=2785524 RepID=UPI00189E25B6|nr:DUF2066 domain-containing protein [Glaciecola sp. MH2013]MBF7072882.1 DUF2066 domain-containing protein [Glaciecola sp. MH2013]
MKLISKILFSLYITCFLVGVADAQVTHLNEGRVPVADQSLSSQKSAGKRAFLQAVVKMSGTKRSADNLVIRRAATNFEQYLISSSYEQEGQSLFYLAEFNQSAIVDLLRAELLPVWGARRPTSIMWLAVEDDATKQKALLTQTIDNALIDGIRDASYQRGIELIVPIGDLNDSMNVSTNDVWNLYSSTIYNQSLRYGTNYVIGAKVGVGFDDVSATEQVILSYFVTNGKTLRTGEVVGKDTLSTIIEFISLYADQMAQAYAVDINADMALQDIIIKVSNVTSLKQYHSVLDILKSLTVTDSVELSSQERDISIFRIKSRVDADQVNAILSLESRLIKAENANDISGTISYRVRGK